MEARPGSWLPGPVPTELTLLPSDADEVCIFKMLERFSKCKVQGCLGMVVSLGCLSSCAVLELSAVVHLCVPQRGTMEVLDLHRYCD